MNLKTVLKRIAARPTPIQRTIPQAHDPAPLVEQMAALYRAVQLAERPSPYVNDPAKWVYDNLGYEVKGMQPELLASIASGRDTAVRTGHKCGKSFSMACTTLWWLETRAHSKVLTTAPGERQLKYILWSEIAHLYKRWKRRDDFVITDGMFLYHKLFKEDWFALGIYSSDSANIEGFHTREHGKQLIIVDEAKAVDDSFFSAIASMSGQRVMTSVPPLDGQGYFVRAFRENKELWNTLHMSTLESPFADPAWLRAMEKEWVKGSVTWQAKIEGNFPKGGQTNIVCAAEKIEQAQQRWEKGKEKPGARPVIGVDVARFGDDWTTGWSMRGLRFANHFAHEKQDLMATVGAIREFAAEEARHWNEVNCSGNPKVKPMKPEQVPVYVDDTGLGGGVTDRLIELDQEVTGVNFGARADDPEQYQNKRAEMWFEFASGLDQIELPPDYAFEGAGSKLSAELSMPTFAYTSTGRKLEPKDAIKKRLGRSPDSADAAVLAYEGARFYIEDAEGAELVSQW